MAENSKKQVLKQMYKKFLPAEWEPFVEYSRYGIVIPLEKAQENLALFLEDIVNKYEDIKVECFPYPPQILEISKQIEKDLCDKKFARENGNADVKQMAEKWKDRKYQEYMRYREVTTSVKTAEKLEDYPGPRLSDKIYQGKNICDDFGENILKLCKYIIDVENYEIKQSQTKSIKQRQKQTARIRDYCKDHYPLNAVKPASTKTEISAEFH